MNYSISYLQLRVIKESVSKLYNSDGLFKASNYRKLGLHIPIANVFHRSAGLTEFVLPMFRGIKLLRGPCVHEQLRKRRILKQSIVDVIYDKNVRDFKLIHRNLVSLCTALGFISKKGHDRIFLQNRINTMYRTLKKEKFDKLLLWVDSMSSKGPITNAKFSEWWSLSSRTNFCPTLKSIYRVLEKQNKHRPGAVEALLRFILTDEERLEKQRKIEAIKQAALTRKLQRQAIAGSERIMKGLAKRVGLTLKNVLHFT